MVDSRSSCAAVGIGYVVGDAVDAGGVGRGGRGCLNMLQSVCWPQYLY